MKKLLLFKSILIFCLCSSCNNKKDLVTTGVEQEQVISPSQSYSEDFQNQEKIRLLSDKVKFGDTTAYRKLRHLYFYSGHVKEFLFNALTMADKHQYPLAYYDVYTILYSPDEQNGMNNKLANYYLFLAYEKKAEHSEGTIKERFGESFKIPNTKDYWIKINE